MAADGPGSGPPAASVEGEDLEVELIDVRAQRPRRGRSPAGHAF